MEKEQESNQIRMQEIAVLISEEEHLEEDMKELAHIYLQLAGICL